MKTGSIAKKMAIFTVQKNFVKEKSTFSGKNHSPPKWKEWTEDLQFRLELATDGV